MRLQTVYGLLLLMLVACTPSQYKVNNKLYHAVLEGNARGVFKAAEQGAEINLREADRGWTPLLMAIEARNAPMVRLLLNYNADPNLAGIQDRVTPLHRAAALGDEIMVRLLIDKGADLNAQDAEHRSTALMWAAVNGHHDVVEMLLEHNALVNVRGNRGESALYLAVSNEDSRMVALLLAYGAVKDRPDIYGTTPLQKAREMDQTEIIGLLQQ